MSGTALNVRHEFEYPPLPAIEEDPEGQNVAYHRMFDRIKSLLVEENPNMKQDILQSSVDELIFQIHEVCEDEEDAYGPSKAGSIFAGLNLVRKKTSVLLLLPAHKVAGLINTTEPEHLIHLSRVLFWEFIYRTTEDDAEEVTSEGEEMEEEEDEDEYNLLENAAYQEGQLNTEYSDQEVDDEEEDPRTREDYKECINKSPWLMSLYYSILASTVNDSAGEGVEG